MISGTRLKEALVFQKTHIEKTLWETASKMIQLERNLNVLRVDEIISWHQARDEKLTDARGSIQRIGDMIDAKMSRANDALRTIKDCETSLGELRHKRKAIEARVIAMKTDLYSKTRANLERAKSSPEVVDLKMRLKELDQQVQKTSAEYAKAKTEHPVLMAKFDADKTFQYLFRRNFGTSEYKANSVVAKLDEWLADKIDFMYAASIYQNAVTIDKKMEDFLASYGVTRTNLHNQLAAAEQEIQQELDADRAEFSDVVNTLQAIDKKLEETFQKMDVSKGILKAIISADDKDFQSMNEQLIKMLAREKAAAAVRFSKQNSPVVIIERNKAIAFGQDRLTVSIEADGMRRLAKAQNNRVVVIDELLRRLTARQWLTDDSYFDLDERSELFIDISFRDARVDTAWPLLQQAYLPAEAVMSMESKPSALSA